MKMLIGGQKRDSSDKNVFDVINPITNEVVDTAPFATLADINEVIDNARKGFKEWSAYPLSERARILEKFVGTVKERANEIVTLLTKESGKTVAENQGEIGSIVGLFTGYIEKAKHMYGAIMPDSAGTEKDITLVRREPLGVVVCIVPFNYPLDLFSHKVAPALIMGNSVIVKPSSDNPLAVLMVAEILIECGVPGNAVQVVTGSGSVVGKMLSSSPKINAISITGSTSAGIDVAKNAAQNLTRVFLELGGNDAFLVFEDADLDLVADEAIFTRTYNMGQTCAASKRFIIHKVVKENFINKLIERLKKIKIGDPFDPATKNGCLISQKAAIEVEEQVQKTVAQGAKLIYGGKRNGAFFEPTVLNNVTTNMDIAIDMEVFGPVYPVIEFETMEEAISIANQSMYGLSGSVFSANLNTAMKVAEKMECGSVIINGGLYRTLEMSFGGFKKSGIGREGIAYTLEEMSQVKNYVLKGILR